MEKIKQAFDLVCRGCQIKFKQYNKNVRYCSGLCKKKHYYLLYINGELTYEESENDHHWIQLFEEQKKKEEEAEAQRKRDVVKFMKIRQSCKVCAKLRIIDVNTDSQFSDTDTTFLCESLNAN